MNNQSDNSFLSYIKDIWAIIAIIGFGWFLIGYYWQFQYLNTTYPDWMFHAFRIQSLSMHGFVSWDHIWSSGIHYWYGYQYLPHLLALLVSRVFSLTVTQGMIWLTIFVFITSRVSMYLVMRSFKIPCFIAMFATLCSFAFAQEWYAIRDFSIYIAVLVLPLYIFVWVAGMNNFRYVYIFSALTGIAWMFHPVLGYTVSGLLFFTLLLSLPKTNKTQVITTIIIWLISSTPFTIPFFFSGYKYVNPILSSAQFLRELLTAKYLGLSITGMVVFFASWVITFIKTSSIERWPRLLLLFCTFYMMCILLGQSGYFPNFINQLQISRGILFVGMMLPYIFGIYLSSLLSTVKSKFVHSVLLVCLAMTLTETMYISSVYSAIASNDLDNPVAKYVTDREIKGSIFTDDVAEASYFSPNGVRFVNSYNEHAELHPLSQRFNKLMKNDLTFTGVSIKQQDLIVEYANVLGLEYIFIPDFSPLAKNNALTDGNNAPFKKVAYMKTTKGTYAILRNKKEVQYAYIGDKNILEKISKNNFVKPTLLATSFKEWDQEITNINDLVEKKQLKPVPLSFVNTDQIDIDLSQAGDVSNKFLLITQSYENNWSPTPYVDIQPSSLRFMLITDLTPAAGNTLSLKHNWPVWYWPVQFLAIITTVIVFIWQMFFTVIPKKQIISLEKS